MTLRLLGLMSVVLLLSLGAFGLLVGHYQDQVMQEVARTASAVGQATLRTLEIPTAREASLSARARDILVRHTADGEDPCKTAEPGTVEGPVVPDGADDLVGSPAIAGADGRIRERKIRRVEKLEQEGGTAIVEVRCQIDGAEEKETCVTVHAPAERRAVNRFFVRIDEIRAESDPDSGLVLTIPTLLPEENEAARQAVVALGRLDEPDAGQTIDGAVSEIRLPIPVKDFQALFDSMRGRSLFLFLGVFLVGTVLSAGLVTRFTRPIRRLDAGIRRLSEGDLDAAVEVHGKDEIARLSRAFNDMTRKLRASRERSRDMVRREKLTALGRLAAGVAHDVRNPLHSIGLTLQHLRETCRPEAVEPAAEFDRSLDIIRGEIRRLDQTVSNFLRFATSDRRERQQVDFTELLRETARLVSKEAEWRKVEVSLAIDESAPEIAADGESIRSAILNLVLNSFEAMPQGGRLTLSLRVEGQDLVLEVADTGGGIPKEDHDRVFDFAYTTREGGSGLGLAIVHQCIVEEHGGRVTLDSRPGDGTRVTMALPWSRDARAESEKTV